MANKFMKTVIVYVIFDNNNIRLAFSVQSKMIIKVIISNLTTERT
jgi:hypothetical protein